MNNNSGKLIITRIHGYIFSVLLDSKGKACRISVSDDAEESIVGNVYIARVDNVIPNAGAAFLQYENGLMGYFKLDEYKPYKVTDANEKARLFKKKNRILVQASRDALGSKIPSLTTLICITGKYVILCTSHNELRFSAKFNDPVKKKELQKAFAEKTFEDIGFVIRTNALFADVCSISEEMDIYNKIWIKIKNAALTSACPSLLYRTPFRTAVDVRDIRDDMMNKIITDDIEIYGRLKEYISVYQPMDLDKLVFYGGETPLHVLYEIKDQIRKALAKKVWLKSGAYIVIEPTEALVAIDVNSGKNISGRDPEQEHLKVNLEAAGEIARQIVLRNLSGTIIIDFISMKKEENKKLLMEHLKSQLQFDPIKSNIVDMTKLNLVELTRQKIRRPLHELVAITDLF